MTMQDIKENRILLACGVILLIAALAGLAYYAGWF
jgi:hypothetical protein